MRATLGLALAGRADQQPPSIDLEPSRLALLAGGRDVDAALLTIAADSWCGRTSEAVTGLARLIDVHPRGSAWSAAVDPMLARLRGAAGMDRVLARLAAKAA